MSFSLLACAVVAIAALGYAALETRSLLLGSRSRVVSRKQQVRRVAGALLVALLMGVVEAGLEWVSPFRAPGWYVGLWSTAALVVLALVGLAYLDLRELRANQDIEHARNLLRFRDSLRRGEEDSGPLRRQG